MKTPRRYSKLDNLCLSIDQALKAVLGHAKTTHRPNPANLIPESPLTEEQRKHSAALMRINHAGEVCAQALYHGQGLASRCQTVREKMQHAAIEEGDHLAWCRARLVELSSHTSYFNPLWYAGSFAIGLTAGLIGDKWSLGFLAETENQVVQHLAKQMHLLPEADKKSQHILKQMQHDEEQHRDEAHQAGAADLPLLIKKVMKFSSKIMVKTAYRV